MTTIAVFSDSHGRTSHMLEAVRTYSPDVLIHLGDYARDARELAETFPDIPLYAVRGNCDPPSDTMPETLQTELEGHRLFMTHGHRYNVKLGLDPLLNCAHFSGAGLVLFGHTHRAVLAETGNMYVLNPGSAGAGSGSSFALIKLMPDTAPDCRIIPL